MNIWIQLKTSEIQKCLIQAIQTFSFKLSCNVWSFFIWQFKSPLSCSFQCQYPIHIPAVRNGFLSRSGWSTVAVNGYPDRFTSFPFSAHYKSAFCS